MPRHSARQRDGQSFTRTAKNARRNSAGAKASSRRSRPAVERRRKVIAMKCAEVRKFVRLYLDSELDAKHSFEVEQHLESCVECAGLFEAEKKFDVQLDTAAFAYLPSQTTFSSSGARLCHVEGVPVALILGHCGETPVSMIVFKKSEIDRFPETKRKLESGDPIACSHSGRYQFAARFVDDHVVCVVGDRPRPALEDLLRTVRRADG